MQYENGGGAFLIPYLVVLLLIGKPLYFLDMILGQFSNYGSVKVWAVVPLAKGKFKKTNNCYIDFQVAKFSAESFLGF